MFGILSRPVTALTAFSAACLLSTPASAQFFGGMDPCNPCAQAVAPVVSMVAPIQTAAINPCPCIQPVQQTVYREVPVTEMRAVQKTVKKPVVTVQYEERPVTAYRPITETRTAEIPSVQYQTVTECQPQMVNRSYWRTVHQPVPKVAPCQYDPRPTFMGMMNRTGYSLRSAFTPNYIPRREFVPNVTAYNAPVQRTVAIPTTRQVAYQVTRMEPYTTTQKVAVQKIDYVDATVTAYEPYTVTKTVAVGTTTSYAYVPMGGLSATAFGIAPSTTATAAEPTPVRSAEKDKNPGSTQNGSGELFKPLSYPTPVPEQPREQQTSTASEPTVAFSPSAGPTAARAGGWKAYKPRLDAGPTSGPALSVAAK